MADAGGGDRDRKARARDPSGIIHGHRERFRQRLLQGDGGGLQDYELLELLLCAFIPSGGSSRSPRT